MPKPVKASRRSVKLDPDGSDSRQRILNAAEAQFARDGFDATPTARIADAAGVPKGLLFYYFPKKIDVLRALLAERMPTAPLCGLAGIVRIGDLPGSLLRLARKLGLGQHDSIVLRSIVFREAGTHPEVRDHIRALRQGLLELTEAVLDGASEGPLDPKRRRQAAQTYVAVMLDEANSRRFDGAVPDLDGAARIVSAGLTAT
ncbi:MAG TPA: TetR/AcrR family transcriptional regulator [Jatrophihabitans sp.]|jgi:AcrR family transcriptional regulator